MRNKKHHLTSHIENLYDRSKRKDVRVHFMNYCRGEEDEGKLVNEKNYCCCSNLEAKIQSECISYCGM